MWLLTQRAELDGHTRCIGLCISFVWLRVTRQQNQDSAMQCPPNVACGLVCPAPVTFFRERGLGPLPPDLCGGTLYLERVARQTPSGADREERVSLVYLTALARPGFRDGVWFILPR
ncbi:hypothetical protein AVEN_55551-1 [Araneus ventricosus]|uniref:Uncharacterized protein n=1 Tax=Araneus ventricosus TaxID=182803 RepID=A0A4Y2WQY3_ARAVE|nr:hypothetical protein AVEN_55551-1 [Araneus ventricosus]